MNRKQLAWLGILALAVVVVAVCMQRLRARAWETGGKTIGAQVLPDFPLNSVEKVGVTARDGTLELAKKDGAWRVLQRYDYPADFEALSIFLKEVADLKAAQTLSVAAAQYARLELLPPGKGEKSGTEITFSAAGGKKIAALVLGKEHKRGGPGADEESGWADGRYVLVPASGVVALVSQTFSSVTTKPQEWLDKEFFKTGELRNATLSQGGSTLWELSREKSGDPWKLTGLGEKEALDDAKVQQITGAFAYSAFDDVADPKLPVATTGLDTPKVFRAVDTDGFVYTVNIGKPAGETGTHAAVTVEYDGPKERLAAADEKPEDKAKKDDEFKKKQEADRKQAAETAARLKNWVYIVPRSTTEKIVLERKDLIKAPPAPAPELPGAAAAAGPTLAPPPPPAPPAAPPAAK